MPHICEFETHDTTALDVDRCACQGLNETAQVRLVSDDQNERGVCVPDQVQRIVLLEGVLCERAHFDLGVLHYASDTPYSRRQSLLSKSLGYFGMDSSYACASVITRRILEREIARVSES